MFTVTDHCENEHFPKVIRPININSHGEEIDLKARRYRIYVLGGFGANLGKFSISFKHNGTSETATCKKAFWPVQAYAFGKRAKRIFIVHIPEEGRYEVVFSNPETIRVKHSNLPIGASLSSPLSTEQIEIVITEKFGFFPVLK